MENYPKKVSMETPLGYSTAPMVPWEIQIQSALSDKYPQIYQDELMDQCSKIGAIYKCRNYFTGFIIIATREQANILREHLPWIYRITNISYSTDGPSSMIDVRNESSEYQRKYMEIKKRFLEHVSDLLMVELGIHKDPRFNTPYETIRLEYDDYGYVHFKVLQHRGYKDDITCFSLAGHYINEEDGFESIRINLSQKVWLIYPKETDFTKRFSDYEDLKNHKWWMKVAPRTIDMAILIVKELGAYKKRR